MPGSVLLVDDDSYQCELITRRLQKHGFTVVARASAEEALPLAAQEPFELVITDLKLPGLSGTAFCRELGELRPDLPVIIITGYGTMDTAIEALRGGAQDFIPKPIELNQLVLTIERTLSNRQLRAEVRRLRQEVAELRGDEIVGESPAVELLRGQIRRVAKPDTTVLILGESGTGKELVARQLHRSSSRAEGPFVAVSCAAIPEHLFESELFGHVRGAFSGALTARTGLLQAASGGTFFLDEVGDLPMSLQTKLLRVLQEKRVRPVGAVEEVPVDIRLLAATNRNLSELVATGHFRQDLFFRLNVLRIDVPPLRTRGRDVLLIAQHFVKRFSQQMRKQVQGITTPTATRLITHDWPGNIRELQNYIERAVALTEFDQITPRDLPATFGASSRATGMTDESLPDLPTIEQLTLDYARDVLRLMNGDQSQAARVLGTDRRTLQRLLADARHIQSDAAGERTA